MEIIATTTMTIRSISGPRFLQFDSTLLHFHAPVGTSNRYPVISRPTLPKPRITTCSLADETTFNTATKVAVEDPSLAVKKKAADISLELKGTSIFLLGMNNSMKTNLGKLLADVLRYYYFDSDNLVFEAAGGEAAAKAFRDDDEKAYQQAETEVLKQLSSMGRLVVCAGNGAVQSSTNLALLRHGISIWIDVPLDMLARVDESELRASELSAIYKEMRAGYATADATISLQKVANQLGYDDLDAVTTEDMTMEVLKEIERLTRLKKMIEEAAKPF